jgi:superfamily II DNA/RNA helicase
MTFVSLNLSQSLTRALSDLGYTEPTPIQTQAIPLALAGRDLIASAATGTGKTAAFLLPALTRLETQKPTPRSAPRILVLTPTRELAMQISAAARDYSKHIRIMQGVLVGGMPYGAQLRLLSQRVDLLIATPGRLIDMLDRGAVNLDRVEMLVLDEADRMLDMGFIHAVRRISEGCPKDRQTLLFTATWDERMAKLGAELLVNPERVAVASPTASPSMIAQRAHLADDTTHKRKLLNHLLDESAPGQVIVFGATKRRVDRLAEELQRTGLSVGALHGDMKQNARNRTIQDLKSGRIRVVIATDVAARGIDIPALSLVVNFDLPNVPEDYVHRIGRTGRAGASGIAVSLVSPDDVPLLQAVDKYTRQTIERVVIPGLEPKISERLNAPPAAKPGSKPGRRRPSGPPQRRPQGDGTGVPSFLKRKPARA